MVAKFAEKRAALKAEGNYAELDKLPKNASPVRLHNRRVPRYPHAASTGRLSPLIWPPLTALWPLPRRIRRDKIHSSI